MIKIRTGTFETNSSSSHSLVVCDEDTWYQFATGKLFFNVLSEKNGYPQFCTFKDIKKYIKDEIENVPLPVNWRDMTNEQINHYQEIKRHHKLCFFQETFYGIDELEGYEYNTDKQEASLDYYFG